MRGNVVVALMHHWGLRHGGWLHGGACCGSTWDGGAHGRSAERMKWSSVRHGLPCGSDDMIAWGTPCISESFYLLLLRDRSQQCCCPLGNSSVGVQQAYIPINHCEKFCLQAQTCVAVETYHFVHVGLSGACFVRTEACSRTLMVVHVLPLKEACFSAAGVIQGYVGCSCTSVLRAITYIVIPRSTILSCEHVHH